MKGDKYDRRSPVFTLCDYSFPRIPPSNPLHDINLSYVSFDQKWEQNRPQRDLECFSQRCGHGGSGNADKSGFISTPTPTVGRPSIPHLTQLSSDLRMAYEMRVFRAGYVPAELMSQTVSQGNTTLTLIPVLRANAPL